MDCDTAPQDLRCTGRREDVELPCGHHKSIPCHQNPEAVRCLVKVTSNQRCRRGAHTLPEELCWQRQLRLRQRLPTPVCEAEYRFICVRCREESQIRCCDTEEVCGRECGKMLICGCRCEKLCGEPCPRDAESCPSCERRNHKQFFEMLRDLDALDGSSGSTPAHWGSSSAQRCVLLRPVSSAKISLDCRQVLFSQPEASDYVSEDTSVYSLARQLRESPRLRESVPTLRVIRRRREIGGSGGSPAAQGGSSAGASNRIFEYIACPGENKKLWVLQEAGATRVFSHLFVPSERQRGGLPGGDQQFPAYRHLAIRPHLKLTKDVAHRAVHAGLCKVIIDGGNVLHHRATFGGLDTNRRRREPRFLLWAIRELLANDYLSTPAAGTNGGNNPGILTRLYNHATGGVVKNRAEQQPIVLFLYEPKRLEIERREPEIWSQIKKYVVSVPVGQDVDHHCVQFAHKCITNLGVGLDKVKILTNDSYSEHRASLAAGRGLSEGMKRAGLEEKVGWAQLLWTFTAVPDSEMLLLGGAVGRVG